MKLPKELITVTPLSKFVALILFISLPILFFFIGVRYQTEINNQSIYNGPAIISTQPVKPSVPGKMQQPYGKVSISGKVTAYDENPAVVDGSPLLKVQIKNGPLFEVLLPSGESACTLTAATNAQIQSINVGDTVEVYGTAATNERILVCDSDEYVRIVSEQTNSSLRPFKVRTLESIPNLQQKKNYVINSQTEWNALNPTANTTPINFDQNTIIVVAQGQKPTGGYSIVVENIEQINGDTKVSIKETSPGKDCMVTQAFTTPFQIVEVQKINTPVTFTTHTVTTDCS